MACQCCLKEILDLNVYGLQRHLIYAEFVQAEHLHEHAIQAHGLVLDDALFAAVA